MVCEGSCGVPLGERKFLLTSFVNIWAASILHLMCFSAVLLPPNGFFQRNAEDPPNENQVQNLRFLGFWVPPRNSEMGGNFSGVSKDAYLQLIWKDARLWKEKTQRLMAWCERSLKIVKIERKQESFHRGTISGVKPLANGDLWNGWKCMGR